MTNVEQTTAEVIDEEISKLIEGQYERAKELLRANRDKLETLAKELLSKEVIFRDNLVAIFGERQWMSREERLAAHSATKPEASIETPEAPSQDPVASNDEPQAPNQDPEAKNEEPQAPSDEAKNA